MTSRNAPAEPRPAAATRQAARKGDPKRITSALAAQIAQEALREDATVDKLADLAVADAAFAMQLLALVNSPAFGRVHKISDIRQAATLLGIRGVRTVALSLLVSGLCPSERFGRTLMANSLRRAVACRLLGAESGYRDLDGAFATGLFLDSGILSHAQDNPAIAAEIAGSPAQHRLIRERVAGLRPHPEVGAELADSFALPRETVIAIRLHHADTQPSGALPALAWLAECVAGVYESPEVDRARQLAYQRAEQLKLRTGQVDTVLQQIPAAVLELAQAMQKDIGEQRNLDDLKADASRLLSEINQEYEGVIRKMGELLNEKEKLAQELRVANEALSTLATTDGLTGLCNRRALEQALRQRGAQAAKAGAWLSIVAVDVDHFKRLNDSQGHAAGDAALTVLGKVLKQHARPQDTAARYGGEEFTLLLPGTPPEQARAIAEQLRSAVSATTIVHEKAEFNITVSLGIGSARGPAAANTTQIMTDADKALYRAKHAGRNRVMMSDGEAAPSAPPPASTRQRA